MELVTVNYSLNQTFHVDKPAIEGVVKKAIKVLRGYKLESVQVDISTLGKDIIIKTQVIFPANVTYAVGLVKVKNSIEEYALNLLDSKPKNIEITVVG